MFPTLWASNRRTWAGLIEVVGQLDGLHDLTSLRDAKRFITPHGRAGSRLIRGSRPARLEPLLDPGAE